MQYFYGGGGNSNPDFCYRFLLRTVTDEMWSWCKDYPLNGPFERWHVRHNFKSLKYDGGTIELPLIQIESRKAAYMFAIAFSEHILKDETYDFVKDEKWITSPTKN